MLRAELDERRSGSEEAADPCIPPPDEDCRLAVCREARGYAGALSANGHWTIRGPANAGRGPCISGLFRGSTVTRRNE